jgi:hypothetical protein
MPVENSVEHELTVSRAFRIRKSDLDILEKEAREQSQSVNEIVNDLIDRYVKWGRSAKTLGSVFVTPIMLNAFLEEIPDEKIIRIAEELAKDPFGPNRVGFPKSADEVLAKYRTLCTFGQSKSFEREDAGDRTLIISKNEVGKKFSLFDATYWKAMFAGAGVQVNTRFTDNLVLFEIRSSDLHPES